jgi:predicted nucleotidyltransferase
MSTGIQNRYSIEELKAIVAPVAEKYGVETVYLFGSVARGDYKENSDYDFCIKKGQIRGLTKLSGFFQDLREAIGHDIDLVTTKSLEPEFLNAIMTEGVLIYGE